MNKKLWLLVLYISSSTEWYVCVLAYPGHHILAYVINADAITTDIK